MDFAMKLGFVSAIHAGAVGLVKNTVSIYTYMDFPHSVMNSP